MSILDSVMGAPGSQGAQGLMRSAVPTAEPSKAVRLQSAIASIVEHLKSHGRAEKDQSFSLRELQQVTRLRPLMPERSLAEIAAALERHSKVALDDYDKYTYRTAIPHVQDREGIKKELKRRLAKESVVGIPINDLEDCYLGAGRDLKTLIKTGEVIAVDHHIVANGRATATIFPRGPVFGVELKPLTDTQKKEVQKRQKKAGNGVGGSGSGDYGENSVYTPFDFTTVVRRGEAVGVLRQRSQFSSSSSSSSSSSFSSSSSSLSSSSSSSSSAQYFDPSDLSVEPWFKDVRRVSTERKPASQDDSDGNYSACKGFKRKYSVAMGDDYGGSKEQRWDRNFTESSMPFDEPLPGLEGATYAEAAGVSSSSSSSSSSSQPVMRVPSNATLVRFGVSTELRKIWTELGKVLPKDESELLKRMNYKVSITKRIRKQPTKKKTGRTIRRVKNTTNDFLKK